MILDRLGFSSEEVDSFKPFGPAFKTSGSGFLELLQGVSSTKRFPSEEARLIAVEAGARAKDGFYFSGVGDYEDAQAMLQKSLRLYSQLAHLAASDPQYVVLVDADMISKLVFHLKGIAGFLSDPYRVS